MTGIRKKRGSRIDGEWQDAETIIDDYGFTMIGHTVGCGEEVSNFYKWDWLYGVLEPGEYRMVYDVFRKTEAREALRNTGNTSVLSFKRKKDFSLDRWVGRM